jgi:hypothetical protein
MLKNHPMFEKVAKTVAEPKNAKISSSMLNLKAQLINIKQLMKPKNAYN